MEINLTKVIPHRLESLKNTIGYNGISTTVRREMGSDIEAACGQLRRSLSTSETMIGVIKAIRGKFA